MEEFKKVFQKMAISYVEYVQKKIDECKTQTTTNDDANNMSITLMNEVRTANVVAVTVMGDPKYRACRVFRVTGFGKFNGRYFIDKVTHNFSDEGYTSTIECHKCVTNIR